jgi:hypothetical protein
MIPVETTLEILAGRRKIKENGRGVNSCMIYLIHCKNLSKYYSIPSPSTIIKEKNPKF